MQEVSRVTGGLKKKKKAFKTPENPKPILDNSYKQLHKLLPIVIYFEWVISTSWLPTFTKIKTKQKTTQLIQSRRSNKQAEFM